MPKVTACPICGKVLTAKEQLVAEWSDKYQWFVLYHFLDVSESTDARGVETIVRRRWCAQANDISLENLTEEWRNNRSITWESES